MNNNNRGNNNRRRGRGNRQNGGNGQQVNRIDSRARGNAPQLLEKYRKLAQDAHLNGDRVTAEYYLQFADHYFRVLADARQRQEEQRLRRDDRWEGGDEQAEDSGDFTVDSDFPSFDQPVYNRAPREDRPRRDEEPRGEVADSEATGDDETASANPYEPVENPFVRADRPTRGLRPRRDDRPARDDRQAREDRPAREERPAREDRPAREERPARAERPAREERRPRRDDRRQDEAPAGLDPSSLPPAIGAPREEPRDQAPVADDAEPAKPRRGRPRKKAADDESGEALESVG